MARVWSTPQTWTDGTVPTGSTMNAQLRDNSDYLYPVIFEATLGADTATWDTGASSIPNTYRNLVIVLEARSSSATSGITSVKIRFNNDSGSNYDSQYLAAVAATPASGESLADTGMYIGDAPLGNSPAGYYSSHHVEVPHYANTLYHKAANSSNAVWSGTSTGNGRTALACGSWRSTAAISRLQVYLATGNVAAGSRLLVYGTF